MPLRLNWSTKSSIKQRDILAPVHQVGHHDGHHIEPVEEIGPEKPSLDLFLQVLVGRGQDPDIDLDGPGAADPLELLFLEDAQDLGLALQAHVADLIQKEGGAVGLVELALLVLRGPGEGALDVAEQLGFDQFLRDGGAVDRDHGACRRAGLAVNGLGHQFLAGAVAAPDQHPGVGGRDPFDLLAQLAIRGCCR